MLVKNSQLADQLAQTMNNTMLDENYQNKFARPQVKIKAKEGLDLAVEHLLTASAKLDQINLSKSAALILALTEGLVAGDSK